MLRELIEEQGFALTHPLLAEKGCEGLITALERLVPESGSRTGGLRNVLSRCPEVRAFVRSRPVHGLVASVMSDDVFAVRAIYFRKDEDANWAARWHRDTVVPLRSGTTAADVAAAEGFSGFSEKEGVPHARAPRQVLARMLTLRLHLDDTDAGNGALQVMPGSHLIEGDEPPEIEPYTCAAPRGTALLMRPLLWHASAKVVDDRPRRVLHVEFADAEPPGELRWPDEW